MLLMLLGVCIPLTTMPKGLQEYQRLGEHASLPTLIVSASCRSGALTVGAWAEIAALQTMVRAGRVKRG